MSLDPRTGETLGATWEEIDFDQAVWTIPGSRMKAGNEHLVPINEPALHMLNTLRSDKKLGCRMIFPGKAGAALSNMAMTQLLRGMGYNGVTVHGFRSTFRDWAGEKTQFAREDIEMALAHTIQSKAERAYRRGKSLEKRRALMQAWANFVFPQKLA